MATRQVFSKGLFRDKGPDYSTRSVLGWSVHGASDVGEVLATIDHATVRVRASTVVRVSPEWTGGGSGG